MTISDITAIYAELNDQQREGAILAAQGYSCKNISIKLNVRQETVSRWKQIPEYQELVFFTAEESRQLLIKRMDQLVDKALTVLENSMTTFGDSKLRLNAAIKVLQITGFPNK